jgi:hypothetical protein
MEVTNYASKGVAGSGLGLGIAGTALGVLNGGLGNILGTGCATRNACGCSEDHVINRYEAAQNARIAELETEVKLRDANAYTDKKSLELYGYIDSRLRSVESQICNQAVVNAQVTANLSCMQGNIATLMGLTKTIIPITNVCPEPMPQYNSWTAPTAAATT